MNKRWSGRFPGVLILALFTCAVIFWPQKFSDFAHTDRVEAQYMFVYTHCSGSSAAYHSTEIQPEEMARVLAPLGDGRLHWRGFRRSILYTGDQTLYSVTMGHQRNNGYVLDARFELLSDGSLYNVWYNVGYIRYRLTDCDVAGVCRELDRVLNIK